MTYRVYITADVEDHDQAVKLLADLEEVVGKADTDLVDSDIEDLDD